MITIVAILAAILIPVVSSMLDSARATQATSRMRNFGNASFLFKAETGYLAPHRIGRGGSQQLFFLQYFVMDYLGSDPQTAKSPLDDWEQQAFAGLPLYDEDGRKTDQVVKISYARNRDYPILSTKIFMPGSVSSNENATDAVKENFYPPNEQLIINPGDTAYFLEGYPSALVKRSVAANGNFYYQNETAMPVFFFDGHVEMVKRAELLGENGAEPLWSEERINTFWFGKPE